MNIEFLAVATAITASACWVRGQPLDSIWRVATRASRRLSSPGRAIAVVVLVSLTLNVGVSLARPPFPTVHDEFSQLLLADTLLLGRVSNPTHPYWRHFETFHVIHQPTYASKYQPAIGWALAVGQGLLGMPIAGSWLSLALACGAFCWMLQAWVPRRWALVGGLLAALHGGMLVMWGQMYWGGSLSMLGAALLFGGARRAVECPRLSQALWMGLGLLLLAMSRPFEGVVTCVPLGLAWLVGMGTGRIPALPMGRKVLLPLVACLALILVFQGVYNYGVTGSVPKTPYQVHEETYATVPVFLWDAPRPAPADQSRLMRALHEGWSGAIFRQQQTFSGYSWAVLVKLLQLWGFYFGLVLTVPLAMLPWIIRGRYMWFAVSASGFLGAIVVFGLTFMSAHYLAPVVPLLLLIVVQGLRQLRVARWRHKGRGRMLLILLFFAYLISLGMTVKAHVERLHDNPLRHRVELAQRLETLSGKHLVWVRYGSRHDIHNEWVYNRADIDKAKVVWAHDLGQDSDRILGQYFGDRSFWRLDADASPPRLTRLSSRRFDVPSEQGPPSDEGSPASDEGSPASDEGSPASDEGSPASEAAAVGPLEELGER